MFEFQDIEKIGGFWFKRITPLHRWRLMSDEEIYLVGMFMFSNSENPGNEVIDMIRR